MRRRSYAQQAKIDPPSYYIKAMNYIKNDVFCETASAAVAFSEGLVALAIKHGTAFECEECQQVFSTKRGMNIHKAKTH